MNIHKKIIERVIITGKQEDGSKAFAYCMNNGYRIVRSGPMQVSFAKYDTSKFKIVAERQTGGY